MLYLGEHFVLLVLLLRISTSAADNNPAGTWVTPPTCHCPNPVYVVGETIELNWTTPYNNYSIALWQSYPPGAATLGPTIYRTSHPQRRVISLVYPLTATLSETYWPTSGLFNWSVSAPEFNLSLENIFFFWLFPLNVYQGSHYPEYPGLSSHYFNITEPEEASTKIPSPSASATAASSTSILTSTPPASNTITPAITGQVNRLSPGASAGIGVGVTIAVICMIAGMLGWCRKRQRKLSLENTARPQAGDPYELPGCLDQKWSGPRQDHGPAEAEVCMVPVELESPRNADMLSPPAMFPNPSMSPENLDAEIRDCGKTEKS
jgi:hypothetical protein